MQEQLLYVVGIVNLQIEGYYYICIRIMQTIEFWLYSYNGKTIVSYKTKS